MSRLANLAILTKTWIAYRGKKEICNYPPTRVWVEPTDYCTLRCRFCGNRLLLDEDRGFMNFELFRRLVDEASGRVQQINLFHRGEPLLHPQICEMVAYASSRGLRTRIHTNGTVLSDELSRELVAAGVAVTSFSFDGYDREMYEANRPGADFDCVLGNIIRFLELKKTSGSRKPFVVIELMEITNLPPGQIRKKRRQFLSVFDGLPLDKFVIRRPHNWAGLIKTDLTTASGHGRIPCPLLWHALVVFWDGRVMPCPQDFFGVLQIGDAQKEPLFECWNGYPIRALRREMSKPDQIERHPCVDCDRLSRLTFAGVPMDYLGRFLSDTLFGNSWLSRKLPH